MPIQNYSTDKSAADPRIDELRAKIRCVEEKRYSVEYHDPEKRSIGNAITVELNDGTKLEEVEVEYPVGHKRRVSRKPLQSGRGYLYGSFQRTEGTPLLMAKFKRHIAPHFDEAHQKKSVKPFPFNKS
jgi:2-methylcitrate dehydratase